MDLEKKIDFKLSYSKHIVFALPFMYRNGRMNYPVPSNMFSVYGTQNLNPDFSQFKQIPKFGAVFTLTPGLSVKWPDFGLGKIAEVKPVPEFLKTQAIAVRRRGILEDLKKFFQIVLTNKVPLVVTGGLRLCTGKCTPPKPLEVSLQANVGAYQAVFSGLSIEKSFQIPIPLSTPEFKFCLPFFNICPKSKENILFKLTASKTCKDNPCQNGGKEIHSNYRDNHKILNKYLNKGLCQDKAPSYVCTCKKGFTGTDCEKSSLSMSVSKLNNLDL